MCWPSGFCRSLLCFCTWLQIFIFTSTQLARWYWKLREKYVYATTNPVFQLRVRYLNSKNFFKIHSHSIFRIFSRVRFFISRILKSLQTRLQQLRSPSNAAHNQHSRFFFLLVRDLGGPFIILLVISCRLSKDSTFLLRQKGFTLPTKRSRDNRSWVELNHFYWSYMNSLLAMMLFFIHHSSRFGGYIV